MKRVVYLSLLFLSVCAAEAQVKQSHPEYCGIPGDLSPALQEVSATVDQLGNAVLYIGRGNSAKAIPLHMGDLPAVVTAVSQACPLSDGRLVVLGEIGATYVFVTDPVRGSLVDSFWSYWPVISPDQHWIAYEKFFPLHGVDGSSEIMIYDLTKDPAENRRNGEDPITDVGKLIYPPGHENFPGSNVNVPEDQHHSIGRRMYWAPDSRAISFEDHAGAKGDPGIALVNMDKDGNATAFRHPLTPSELCGREIAAWGQSPWWINRIEIGPDEGSVRSIFVDITSADARCAPHTLELHSDQFRPAKTELHTRPPVTRGMVVDGVEVMPPPKKKQ